MPFLTTLGMIVGGASAVNSFFKGGNLAAEARAGLSKLKDQELTNAFAGLKPSLAAEQRILSQQSTQLGTVADVAQGMDAASAMGLLQAGQANILDAENKAFESMLDKEFQADVLRGQDEQEMRRIQEQRTQIQRQTLSQQMMAGEQMQADALMDAATLAVSAGTAQDMATAQAGIDPKAAKNTAKMARQAKRAANPGLLKQAFGKGTQKAGGSFFGNAARSVATLGKGIGKGAVGLFKGAAPVVAPIVQSSNNTTTPLTGGPNFTSNVVSNAFPNSSMNTGGVFSNSIIPPQSSFQITGTTPFQFPLPNPSQPTMSINGITFPDRAKQFEMDMQKKYPGLFQL
tara:strand:+ start:1145 stop:2176 length:1032 start_codon:yes stop_codon:yes gene_type:complete